MRISKALKNKNLLTGEVTKLSETIRKENVQLNDNVSRFDVREMYERYKQKTDELVELKMKIAQANSPIWGKIFKIVELKGRISFLKSLDTKEGTFKEASGFGATPVENRYKPDLNARFVQDEISALEKEITALQDEIDDHNHSFDV